MWSDTRGSELVAKPVVTDRVGSAARPAETWSPQGACRRRRLPSRVSSSPSSAGPACVPATRPRDSVVGSTARHGRRCPCARRAGARPGQRPGDPRTPPSRSSARPACWRCGWCRGRIRAGDGRWLAGRPSTRTRTSGSAPGHRARTTRPGRRGPRVIAAVDAVADTMRPRTPVPSNRGSARLGERRPRPDDGPTGARTWSPSRCGSRPTRRSSVGGAVRSCSRSTTSSDPLHVSDAALLWTGDEEPHGFGHRARTHASIAPAGGRRGLAGPRPAARAAVPDQITLDTDELGQPARARGRRARRVGVDVLWPRSLGRDLTTTTGGPRAPPTHATRGAAVQDGCSGPDAMFSFHWQVALHGEPLTDDEMDQLAGGGHARAQAARQLDRRRPGRRPQGQEAADPHRHPAQALAAALTGVEVDGRRHRATEVIVGRQPARRSASAARAATREPPRAPPGCGRRCATTSGTA